MYLPQVSVYLILTRCFYQYTKGLSLHGYYGKQTYGIHKGFGWVVSVTISDLTLEESHMFFPRQVLDDQISVVSDDVILAVILQCFAPGAPPGDGGCGTALSATEKLHSSALELQSRGAGHVDTCGGDAVGAPGHTAVHVCEDWLLGLLCRWSIMYC